MCVYSVLTTEQDVDPPIKSERTVEQESGLVFDGEFVDGVRFTRSWSRIAIKIQNSIDVGIVCDSCSIKFWGKIDASSPK
jgi:hypothetical protein